MPLRRKEVRVYARWLVKIRSCKYFKTFIIQAFFHVLFHSKSVQMISHFLHDKIKRYNW